MESGIRRVELEIVAKTGLMQVGVISEVPLDVWNDENAADVWYMMSNGDLYRGGTRMAKTGKCIRVGDIIGLEIDMKCGRTIFRKVASKKRGNHVFGSTCTVYAYPRNPKISFKSSEEFAGSVTEQSLADVRRPAKSLQIIARSGMQRRVPMATSDRLRRS